MISPLAGLSKTKGGNLGKLLLLALVPLFCHDPVARAPSAGPFSGVSAGESAFPHRWKARGPMHRTTSKGESCCRQRRSRTWHRSQVYFRAERSQSFHCVTFSSVGQTDRQHTYVLFFLIPCRCEHTPFSFTLLTSGGRDM